MAIPHARLKAEFKDYAGNDYTIYVRDSSLGTATDHLTYVKAGGFTIDWNASSQEIQGGVMPSKCSLEIEVHNSSVEGAWIFLLNSEEGDFWLDIRDDAGDYFWVGEILIDQCKIEVADKPYKMTLVAADRIALAKDIPCDYNPGAGTINYSIKTHFEAIIPEFLNNLDFWPAGEKIVSFSHYIRSTTMATDSVPTFWEQRVGMDDDLFDLDSIYSQLEEICTTFNVRFVYAFHQFWFFPVFPFPHAGYTPGQFFTNFYEYDSTAYGTLDSMFLYLLTPSGSKYTRRTEYGDRNGGGVLQTPYLIKSPTIRLLPPLKEVSITGPTVGERKTTNSAITASKKLNLGTTQHIEQGSMASKDDTADAWSVTTSNVWREENSGTAYHFLELTTKQIADHRNQVRREIEFTSYYGSNYGSVLPHYVVIHDGVYYLPTRVTMNAETCEVKIRAVEIG